jgi:3-phenylpropionate/trans-cinnamate dioxygenase ferredoxin reductase subunit
LSVLCFRHHRLIAVESVNRAADHMAARRLLARTTTLSPQEAAAEGFDLKTYEASSR